MGTATGQEPVATKEYGAKPNCHLTRGHLKLPCTVHGTPDIISAFLDAEVWLQQVLESHANALLNQLAETNRNHTATITLVARLETELKFANDH